MLRIDEIRLHPGEDESILPERAAARLHLPVGALNHFRIVRRSVDARKEVSLVYSVQLQVRGEEKSSGTAGTSTFPKPSVPVTPQVRHPTPAHTVP